MTREENNPTSTPRRGRRPGASHTRQAILDAARTRFAEDGYAAATIRKIAVDAGVNPALIMQFFGTKEDLFAAVMSLSPDALARIAQAFDGPEPTLGERVTRACLALGEGDPESAKPMVALLRAAITTPQAAAQLRELIQARLLHHIRPPLHESHEATVRAGLAATMLIGVIVGRRIVEVPTLIDEDLETIIRMVSPAIQTLLTTKITP